MVVDCPSTSVACTVCGKTLSRKADLPRHMRTHAANKQALMHSCPYSGCDYKSLQRSNLTTHMNTHTGQRPNKCPTSGCNYSTSDPGSLTRHRKAIHGYEPKAANPLVRPSNATRKAARRQRRTSPYANSSSSSSSCANSPASSSDSYEAFICDLPELPQTSYCSSPSPSDIKNSFPAYLTPLIPEFPEPSTSTSTPPFALLTQNIHELPAPSSEGELSEEMLRMLEHWDLQCSTPSPLTTSDPQKWSMDDIEYLCSIPAPSVPAAHSITLPHIDFPTSLPMTQEDSNLILGWFLSQFPDFMTCSPPPPPLPFPLCGAQHSMSMNDTLYAYPCLPDALLYESQWSQPVASYTLPALPVEDFSLPVDWSSFDTAAYQDNAFFANQIFVC